MMKKRVMILPDDEGNPETRNINFIINDGTSPIQSATVTIGEKTGTTGSQGGCTLQNVTDGENTVIVTADGYKTKTETITVDETHTSFTISLEADIPTKTVSIIVQDNDSAQYINGATVTVDNKYTGVTGTGDSQGSDTDGLLVLDLPIKEEYLFNITATGYREYNNTERIVDDFCAIYLDRE